MIRKASRYFFVAKSGFRPHTFLPEFQNAIINVWYNADNQIRMESLDKLAATQRQRIARIETWRGNWSSNDLKPNSEEHMRLVIEEAVAVAYDCANR